MGEPRGATRVESSTGLASSIRVGGAIVGRGAFVAALERSEPEAVRRLVRQIRDDRNADAPYSLGLELASRPFRPVVMAYLLARECRGDVEMAEEAWNDTLFRLYRGIEEYDSTRSRFRTWVVNQARYAAMDLRRKLVRRGKHETLSGDLWSDLAGDVPSRLPVAVDPDGVIPEPLTVPETRALRQAMSALNETQRKLLWYRFVMEFDHVEIARRRLVDVAEEEYVRVDVNRAARRLAELFHAEMVGTEREDGGSHGA